MTDPLHEAIARVTSKEVLPLKEGFDRLPGHVIANELYVAQKALVSFYETMKNGDDFDKKRFDKILKDLNSVKKSAKTFNAEEDIPVSYQYKK